MSLPRLTALVFLSAMLALPAQAQLGAAIGFRALTGDETLTTNTDRRGVEGRLQYGLDPWGAFGWQAEVIGAQMRFQRDDGVNRYTVSENHVEFAALLRGHISDGALTGVYGLAGPVASWRLHCGASGQNSTPCDPGNANGVGVALGVGFQSPFLARRDLTFEVRYYDRVVAGAGSPIVTLSLGLVAARR